MRKGDCVSSRQFSFSFLLPLFLFPLNTHLSYQPLSFLCKIISQGEHLLLSTSHSTPITTTTTTTIITHPPTTCNESTPNVRHNVTVSDLSPHSFTTMGLIVLDGGRQCQLFYASSSTASPPTNAPHDINASRNSNNSIPKFFFPHGKPLPVAEQERKLRKVVVSG